MIDFLFLTSYLIWAIIYILFSVLCHTTFHEECAKVGNRYCKLVLYSSGCLLTSGENEYYIQYGDKDIIAISLYKETIPADEDEHIYDEKIWTPIEK